jgi:hypothetical protein
MTEYRYLFADVLTDQIKAELPLTNVTFGQELNTSGPFHGELLLSDLRELPYNINGTITPGNTAVYVDRDGTLVWGGILWTRTYSSDNQKIVFGGNEFESYFQKRRINFYYNINQDAKDQLTVVQDLFNQIQGTVVGSPWYGNANANIGVTIPTNTSGITVTKYYNAWDLKPLTEAVYELSQSNTGFDWNIEVSYNSSGNIVKNLALEYPRRGNVYSASNPNSLVLEFPGNIISYAYPEDATVASNTMYGIGAGQNAGKLISTQTAADQIAAGWPVIENQVSYTDYWDTALLDQITYSNLQAVKNPAVVMQIVLPTYVDPILGAYKTGDDFRIRITDDRFPNGIDIVRRLAKYDVTVGDNGPERVTMSFVVTTN